MFVGPGLPAWCGLVVVLQNVIGSLFNSHLFDFTQGWIYVFGVGAFGGALMHRASEESRLDMRAGMRSARAGWQDQPQRP